MKTLEQQIEDCATDTLESIAWGEESVGFAGRESSISVIKFFVNGRVESERQFILNRLRNNGFQV